MLGLRFFVRAFSSCGKRGPLFIAVRGPLTIVASLVAEHRLQMRRLSNGGSRAQSLRGMWDPPRPGLEPVSPALAGGLSTTAPPGKPPIVYLISYNQKSNINNSKETVCAIPEMDQVNASKMGKFGVIFLTVSVSSLLHNPIFFFRLQT